MKICKLDWCDKKVYAREYCGYHYNRLREGKPFRKTVVKKTCSFNLCDREAYVKGLCRTHYSQKHRGLPLTPIKPRLEVSEKPGFRQCRNCNEWKTHEDFYQHSGKSAGLQNECKVCQGKRARRNFLIREGREDEILDS